MDDTKVDEFRFLEGGVPDFVLDIAAEMAAEEWTPAEGAMSGWFFAQILDERAAEQTALRLRYLGRLN